jgi:hypothetical protein
MTPIELKDIAIVVGWALTLLGAAGTIGWYRRKVDGLEKDQDTLRQEFKALEAKVDSRHEDTNIQFTEIKVTLARLEAILLELKGRFDGGRK